MLGCGVSLGGDVGLTCCSLGCNPVLEASSDPSVGVHVVLRGCGIMSGSGRGCPVLLSVVISLACTAGCVSATAPPTSPIGSGSPSSPAQVTVARDLPFAGSAPSLTEWSPPTLDVYTAGEDGGRLLVVILPPHGLTKEQAGAESQLAEALAEREAVAVVANWTQLDEPDASFTESARDSRYSSSNHGLSPSCWYSFFVGPRSVRRSSFRLARRCMDVPTIVSFLPCMKFLSTKRK